LTLIIALPVSDGIVIASDSQITSGLVRHTGDKIFRLNASSIWAASGEVALAQRVQTRFKGIAEGRGHLPGLGDVLAEAIKTEVESLLRLDFRTQFVQGNPEALLNLHRGDFIFVEWLNGPHLLHILVNGTPEWIIGRAFATGNGDLFAYALLGKYEIAKLNVAQATVLAAKVLNEAIQVVSYGLGLPIDIWQLGQGGPRQLPEEEVARAVDEAEALAEFERDLLIRGLPRQDGQQ
jgi:20S proteasome alpha/beta subunit